MSKAELIYPVEESNFCCLGNHSEKDKGKKLTSFVGATVADINQLLEEHKAALLADLKSSFESLASTLDSIHSTLMEHEQHIFNAVENNRQQERACSVLRIDNDLLRAKVADAAEGEIFVLSSYQN